MLHLQKGIRIATKKQSKRFLSRIDETICEEMRALARPKLD